MITFPNWRNVGLAMRWARQQAHIQADATTMTSIVKVTDNRWRSVPNGTRVMARHAVGYDRTDVEVGRKDLDLTFFGVADAAEVLRVLAALGLIPNEIAYAAEERYGRCAKCDQLVRWSPPSGDLWPGRWFHVHDRDEQFTDYADHLAEVAEWPAP